MTASPEPQESGDLLEVPRTALLFLEQDQVVGVLPDGVCGSGDMATSAPLRLGRREWPRTRTEVTGAAARVTAAIVETTRKAEEETGLRLPGPLGPPPTTTEK